MEQHVAQEGSSILWQGLEYLSLENCLLNTKGEAITADSLILGSYGGKIYRVHYSIKTNMKWEVSSFSVESDINGKQNRISLESDGKGNWKRGGKPASQFQGCMDIDISLTPFTNTLPVRRLDLHVNQAKEIQVLYLDLLRGEIKSVKQKYTRVSGNKYLYENVPNDFQAMIGVDEDGLVVDYPGLFIRKDIKRLISGHRA